MDYDKFRLTATIPGHENKIKINNNLNKIK
jgi:hypothetical protein